MTKRVLIVGGPYESQRIAKGVAAAGWEPVVADGDESLRAVVAASRPALIVLGSGILAADPTRGVQILREAAGRQPRLFFLGEEADRSRVGDMVDAVFVRPAPVADIVRAAAALQTGATQGEAEDTPPPIVSPAVGAGVLDDLAARIDEALEAEMRATLATVEGDPFARATPSRPVIAPGAPPPPAVAPSGVETRAGSPAARGSLAETDWPALMARAYLSAMTGRLTLSRPNVDKAIYFQAGRPVQAVSSATEDRMVEMLARQGKLTREQHAEAVKVADESGRRMGALLLDLGVLKSDELLPAVREHYEEIILSLFDWSDGDWRFDAGVAPDDMRMRFLRHPAALLREGLRRGYSLARVKNHLGAGNNRFRVEVRGAGSDLLDEILLDPDEHRMVFLFDGVRTVDDVVRTAGKDEAQVLEVAFALWLFGLLRAGEADLTEGRDPPHLRDRQIERERILTRYTLAQESDYFQFLGVDRHATADDIRRAHDRLRRDCAAERLAPDVVASLSAELAVLNEVLDEALRVLGDSDRRDRYRAQLARFPAPRATPRAEADQP